MPTDIVKAYLDLAWPGVVEVSGGLVKDVVFWSPDFIEPPLTVGAANLSVVNSHAGLTSSGIGTSFREAADATIGEALERYALYDYSRIQHRLLTWRQVPVTYRLPLEYFFRIADGQEYEEGQRNLEETDQVEWAEGRSLKTGHDVWIPKFMVFGGDLVYGPTISTGAALSRSQDDAVLSGLFEALERHFFISAWLNKRSCPVLIHHPFEYLVPQGAELYLIHLANLSVVHVVAAVIIGPLGGFVIGAACRPDLNEAAYKAVMEALQSYIPERHRLGTPVVVEDVRTFVDHAEIYLNPSRTKDSEFLWAGSSEKYDDSQKILKNTPEDIVKILGRFLQFDPVVVDITCPELHEMNLTVVKVIAFGLMDIYPARIPYYGGDWNAVVQGHEYNRHPHPFP